MGTNENNLVWFRSHYSYYLAIYILSLQVLNTNTGYSAPHWKLIVVENGKNIITPNPGLSLPSSGTVADGGGGRGIFRDGLGMSVDDDIDGQGNGSYVHVTNQRSSQQQQQQRQSQSQSQSQKLKQSRSGSGNNNKNKKSGKNDMGNLGIGSVSQYWISPEEDDELVLKILATTVLSPKGSWTKNGHELYCSNCPLGGIGSSPGGVFGSDSLLLDGSSSSSLSGSSGQLSGVSQDLFGYGSSGDGGDGVKEILDCGRPANFTYYDQLIGVANRQSHPHIPEPQVAMVFRKKGSKKDTIDLNTLERKLRKAKKERPSSVQLYNQIGNFWRIKGHTLRAIECFRRALAVAPNNPEVLHNLARLLLTLQYLDDALFLARRSLELQAPDRSAWQQHFTLGEILKAYGHHQEAVLHFKHTLELRPDHGGAQEALRELEALLAGTGLHICTLLIIIFLVLGVLLVMLSSLENEEPPDLSSRPPPRHFSRALAMRSLKLGISPRALRSKRLP